MNKIVKINFRFTKRISLTINGLILIRTYVSRVDGQEKGRFNQ